MYSNLSDHNKSYGALQCYIDHEDFSGYSVSSFLKKRSIDSTYVESPKDFKEIFQTNMSNNDKINEESKNRLPSFTSNESVEFITADNFSRNIKSRKIVDKNIKDNKYEKIIKATSITNKKQQQTVDKMKRLSGNNYLDINFSDVKNKLTKYEKMNKRHNQCIQILIMRLKVVKCCTLRRSTKIPYDKCLRMTDQSHKQYQTGLKSLHTFGYDFDKYLTLKNYFPQEHFKKEEIDYQIDVINKNKNDTSEKIAVDLWIYFNNRKRCPSTIRKKMSKIKKWLKGQDHKYDYKIDTNGQITMTEQGLFKVAD